MERSKEEIAWATGLFEGEGSIAVGRSQDNGVALVLTMSDKDIVERFATVFPGGHIYERPPRAAHHKLLWNWRLNRRTYVRAALETMLPYLGHRRKTRALEAFAQLDRMDQPLKRKVCCIQGHMFTPENTYIHEKTGYRQCKTCRMIAAQKQQVRKRQAVPERAEEVS